MGSEELKNRLKRDLRRDIPDAVWNSLKEAGEVEEALRVPTGREDLAEQARMLLKVYDAGGGRERASSKAEADISGWFMDDHRLRNVVFTRSVASMAHRHPDVVSFREEVLNGGYPLAYDLTLRCYLQPDGGVRPDAPHGGRLDNLCAVLAQTYQWDRGDAAWFVLCLYTPVIQTSGLETNVTHHDHGPEIGTVTITVEPWLSAETVAAVYRDAQRRMLGKQPRNVSADSLYLLEFAQNMGEGRSWRELMTLWNEENREEGYTDVRNFWRSVERVRRLVLEPGYQQPDPAPGENHSRRIARDIDRNDRLLRSTV